MFIVFIIAASSLDNPSWMPTIIMVVSGLALASGASMLKQIKARDGE